MSSKASDFANKVETVEIDLSEKGLTDLAKMLVQSGRMSAPSFTNWCSRVSPQASRWARAQKEDASKAGPEKKAKEGGSKATLKGEQKAGKAKDVKNVPKLSGFKKAWPAISLTTWEGVLDASEALKRTWYVHNKAKLNMDSDRKVAAQTYLQSLGLTEDEMKASRAWFPILPGLKEKELYDSIPDEEVECPPPDPGPVDSMTVSPSADGKVAAPAVVSYASVVGVPTLVTDQAGRTGTSLQVAALKRGVVKNNVPNKGRRGRG
jgi:hypothetical protein